MVLDKDLMAISTLGHVGDSFYLIAYERPKSVGKNGPPRLLRVNKDFEVSAPIPLYVPEKHEVAIILSDHQHIHVISEQFIPRTRTTQTYLTRLDGKTLQPVGEMRLLRESIAPPSRQLSNFKIRLREETYLFQWMEWDAAKNAQRITAHAYSQDMQCLNVLELELKDKPINRLSPEPFILNDTLFVAVKNASSKNELSYQFYYKTPEMEAVRNFNIQEPAFALKGTDPVALEDGRVVWGGFYNDPDFHYSKGCFTVIFNLQNGEVEHYEKLPFEAGTAKKFRVPELDEKAEKELSGGVWNFNPMLTVSQGGTEVRIIGQQVLGTDLQKFYRGTLYFLPYPGVIGVFDCSTEGELKRSIFYDPDIPLNRDYFTFWQVWYETKGNKVRWWHTRNLGSSNPEKKAALVCVEPLKSGQIGVTEALQYPDNALTANAVSIMLIPNTGYFLVMTDQKHPQTFRCVLLK